MLASTGSVAVACRIAITRNPAVNIPTISIENAEPLPAYYSRQGASTLGVEIYESPATLLGSAVDDGGGNWHYDFTAGTPAARLYFSRRLTGGVDLDSADWPITSVKDPIETWGNTKLKHWRFAKTADLTLTGTSIDGWTDISTNATPTPGAASGTARPTWLASSDGGNDGSLIAPTFLDATGKWGFVTYDCTTDVLGIAALNYPTPGAAQKNFGWMVFRNRIWINLDRICASIGVNARQVIYQSPTTPKTAMLNGAASAQNQVAGVPIGDWCLMMFEFTGSTSDFLKMFNYIATGGNAGTSAGTTGRKEGGDVAAGVFSGIDVAQAGSVQSAAVVTQAEIDSLADYCKYLYQPGVAPCDATLILEGDSITVSPGVHGTPYSDQTTFNPSLVKRHNIATGGETVTNTIAQFPTQALPKKNTGTAPAMLNIYSLLIGVNDVDNSRSATDIYNDIVTNVGLAHAQGMLVVGWNLLDQFSWTVGAKFTEFTALRVLLTANLGSLADAWVNPAGIIPGTGSDGLYWDDNIHPTALGQSYLVPLFRAAVLSLIP